MALIPISMPRIYSEFGGVNMTVQKGPISDGSNSFLALSLVKLASGLLAAVASTDVTCYGQTPDASKASTDVPPAALFGQNHYVFDLKGRIIAVSITDATFRVGATGPSYDGTGGTTTGVALAPGQRYGILRATTGTYDQYQFLNIEDTTNDFFEIVGPFPDTRQAVTDNNPRVLVKILDSVLGT